MHGRNLQLWLLPPTCSTLEPFKYNWLMQCTTEPEAELSLI